MRAVKRHWPIALATVLACGDADPGSTDASDAGPCVPAASPAISLGAAAKGSLTFEPLADGATLPVFDGTQGVVATWLMVRIEGGIDFRPRMAIRVTDAGGVLASGGALLTPFKDQGCGVFLRAEHMVPFDAVCCAKDYHGREVDVTVTVVWDGTDPVTTTLRATLELAPFPL